MSLININLIEKTSSLNSEWKQKWNTVTFSDFAIPNFFSYGFNSFYNTQNLYQFNPSCFGNFSNLMPFYNTTSTCNNIFADVYKQLKLIRSSSHRHSQNYRRHPSYSVSTTLSEAGYNEDKGTKLARTVRKNVIGFNGDCARYVRIALEESGLGTGERGDGHDYAKILSHNKNFKEISTKGVDLSTLPPGCILVYDRGVAGYDKKFGHVEITLGNGQAASDGITNNIRAGARVFVPV